MFRCATLVVLASLLVSAELPPQPEAASAPADEPQPVMDDARGGRATPKVANKRPDPLPIDRLLPGLTHGEVLALIGAPDEERDEAGTRRLLYRPRTWGEPTTSVLIADGRVRRVLVYDGFATGPGVGLR